MIWMLLRRPQALAWLVFMALLAGFFYEFLEDRRNPNRSPETSYSADGVREVVLQRNRAGHYVTAGTINGMPVEFMLDTGATGVAIPMPVAKRLGLELGRSFPVRTANGVSTSYATLLQRVSVGDIALDEVPAGVAAGLGGEQILLGMSFLRHIEFSQRGNTLILRQYSH